MAENAARSFFKRLGEFRLKDLFPIFIGIVIGYILHEYLQDTLTLAKLKALIDYIANTWQKFT